MMYILRLEQVWRRFVTLKVEAENSMEATDKVDAMGEDKIPWGDFDKEDYEVLSIDKEGAAEQALNLTDDEREDIRFALARVAQLNREKAETVSDLPALARSLTEPADRFEALARKVSTY